MPLQIGQHPAHGFDQPLSLLSDCHRRIEHFLRVLLVLEAEAGDVPLPSGPRADLQQALTYFATAAPKHTADEEESLFPRLVAAGAAAGTLRLLERLAQEHGEADGHHRAVEALGRRWLAAGRLECAERADLRLHLVRLRDIYERHISIEDHELFPAAAQVLSDEDLRTVGREMAARRAVPLPVRD